MTQTRTKKNTVALSDFSDLVEIGHGAFGKVYQATHKKSQRIFALKKISKKQIKNQHMINQLNTQIQISKSLKHPNIIKLYDDFEDNDNKYLVLELAQHGQLYSKLTKLGRFTQRQAKIILLDVIAAVQYLHSRNPPIIHRDIKPQNLLLDKNDRVKLADFGWSNFLNKPRKTYCGTFDYLAPEMIGKTGHDQKLDIWCIGVLVYQLLTGRTPFVVDPKTKNQNAKKILEDNIVNVRITFPNDFPTLAKSFVLGMIKRDPKERLTLKQIKQHPWLKQQSPISLIGLQQTPSSTTILNVEQSNGTMVQQLKQKIKQLQKQLHQQRIRCINIQIPKDNTQQVSMLQQIRRLKVTQQMNEKYKKDIDQLWQKINQKDKQIIKLKNILKKYQQIQEDLQKYKSNKNILQEKYNNLKKQLQSSKKIQQQLREQINGLNDNIQHKVKNGITITKNQLKSDQFINYLSNQLDIITQKFNQSKNILNKVLQKQKLTQQKQNQLMKLRIQRNNIKQQIKLQLKQQYQTQLDNQILKARQQLAQQRDKWFKDYKQLKNIYQQSTTNSSDDHIKVSDRQADLQFQIKNLKEVNSYYEKTIKQQQSKILDLQEALKRKK